MATGLQTFEVTRADGTVKRVQAYDHNDAVYQAHKDRAFGYLESKNTRSIRLIEKPAGSGAERKR